MDTARRLFDRSSGQTDGWMDGRTDGRTDGWMDGWTDGRIDRADYIVAYSGLKSGGRKSSLDGSTVDGAVEVAGNGRR